jgi:hypothetical protein
LFAATLTNQASAQFTTLDPQQVSTQAGANVSLVVVDDRGSDLDSIVRADLLAELGFVDFSIYAALPAFFTLAGNPSKATIGNLEVGGAHRWSAGDGLSIVSHLGLVTPTASSNNKAVQVALAGSSGDIADLYVNSLPSTWGIRVAASPRLDYGALFMQGDLGFDFLFPNHASDEVGMRTSIGAGLSAAIATVTLEVANAGLISKKNAFDQTASIGVAINLLLVSPRVTYTTGLGDEFGDEFSLTVGVGVGF